MERTKSSCEPKNMTKMLFVKSSVSLSKNAHLRMSRPHTSLTTAVVLIFPKVCGFCQLFPSLINLTLPSWIHSVPPLFALVSEGNSSRQNGNVCVIYTRVQLRLIFILILVLNVRWNLRSATVHSVRVPWWYSQSNSHCSSVSLWVDLKQHQNK